MQKGHNCVFFLAPRIGYILCCLWALAGQFFLPRHLALTLLAFFLTLWSNLSGIIFWFCHTNQFFGGQVSLIPLVSEMLKIIMELWGVEKRLKKQNN